MILRGSKKIRVVFLPCTDKAQRDDKVFCFGASLAIVGILCKRQTTLVSWHNLSHPAVPSVKVFLRPHVKLYNGEFAKRKKFTSVRNLLSKVCKFLQRMLSRTDMG